MIALPGCMCLEAHRQSGDHVQRAPHEMGIVLRRGQLTANMWSDRDGCYRADTCRSGPALNHLAAKTINSLKSHDKFLVRDCM